MSVISPWIFYVIDLLSKLASVCTSILIFVPIVFFLYWFIGSDFVYIEEKRKFTQKMKKTIKDSYSYHFYFYGWNCSYP